MASESPTDSPAPRRSQREKKTVKPFESVANPRRGKRKRHPNDAEDVSPDREDAADDEQPSDDDHADDEGGDYRAPKLKTPTRRGKVPSGPTPAKKAKTQGSKTTRPLKRGRKPKDGEVAYDPAQVAKETKITADNPLFNAIMNPASALQSTAEDFLESLQQSPGPALAELINLVLRACGCNDSVNADEVLDYDGIVDVLDNFTEGLKQENSPVYPLTSKFPAFKRFRKSLSEFIDRMIISAAELGALYTSDLMETLQSWVVAMSSSQIRSFRHTASVVALEVETALCDVAAGVAKEAEVVDRQREGEKKRKGTSKGGNARLKELDAKAHETRERRNKLKEFLKEFVDGVFVHRYRDLDPNIRAECLRAIGLWFKKYPEYFLNVSYLRYVGWVLSDSNTHVRLEAVKTLSGIYEQPDYIASLNHFTERFKPRLIEMATRDVELSIRVAVIQVLDLVESHSLLEDDEQEKLCLLIFDTETKVRKAVSRFVRRVWEESVDERLVEKSRPSDQDRQRAGVKAITMLLVKWGRILDNIAGHAEDNSVVEDDGRREGNSQRHKKGEIPALSASHQKGRTAYVVEALWDEVDSITDWKTLLDLLLLDHSAAEGDESPAENSRRPTNGTTVTPDASVDEIWRLEEVEESILLEIFVAAVQHAKAEGVTSKKGEEDIITNDITRELIKGLPRLFIKYQTDQARIADVLIIPTFMNLDLYLEMRMISSFASLWDDVSKQFLSHSSLNVLAHAMGAIQYFMDATSLSNTNNIKILELEDELSSLLRDVVAGREEIEIASFTEDEVLSLTTLCTRLAVLSSNRTMTSWIEEDEGGKQSNAWDILSALVERGRLGYKEEAMMVKQTLHVLSLHILWKARDLAVDPEADLDTSRLRETLLAQREALLDKLVEYAVGTQSNVVDSVRRAAFKHLLSLHVLFSGTQTTDASAASSLMSSISISLDDEVQYRCAGFIQAEIERYGEIVDIGKEDTSPAQDGSDSDGEQEPDDDADGIAKESTGKKNKTRREIDARSRPHLEQEYDFMDIMSTFLRAIHTNIIQIQHGAILLTHYGRFGPTFDACSKIIVEILRKEGMMNDHGDLVVALITLTLREAFVLVLEGLEPDETNAFQLSKLLASCLVIRGTQLSIVRRLDSQYVIEIHTELLSWIAKRLAGFELNNNKKLFKLGTTFFRVLIPLLRTIPSRAALKIKAHMDQVLAQAKLEISPTSRVWEPQRAYEKRLATAISKERGTKSNKGKQKVADVAGATSDEATSDGEVPTDHEPRRRSARLQDDIGLESGQTEDDEPEPDPDLMTPKTRPRPKPVRKERPLATPVADNTVEEHGTPVEPLTTVAEESVVNGDEATPKSSRKRQRADDDGDTVSVQVPASGQEEPDVQDEDDEIRIRRKRVRH